MPSYLGGKSREKVKDEIQERRKEVLVTNLLVDQEEKERKRKDKERDEPKE